MDKVHSYLATSSLWLPQVFYELRILLSKHYTGPLFIAFIEPRATCVTIRYEHAGHLFFNYCPLSYLLSFSPTRIETSRLRGKAQTRHRQGAGLKLRLSLPMW